MLILVHRRKAFPKFSKLSTVISVRFITLIKHLCYNRVSICTVFLNTQVEPVAFSSFKCTGDNSRPAVFSLKGRKQNSIIYSDCKSEKLKSLKNKQTNIFCFSSAKTKLIRTCEFSLQSSLSSE